MPVLRMVTTYWVVIPSICGPKSTDSGDAVTAGPTPVPCTVIVNWPALVLEIDCAVKLPALVGWKVKE